MKETNEQPSNAIESSTLLAEAYKQKFGHYPDNIEMMAINASAKRVDAGEKFEWIDDGNWRRLQFS